MLWCEANGLAYVNTEQLYEACKKGYLATPSDWSMVRVRWIFGEEGGEAWIGEANVDDAKGGFV